MKMSVSGSVTLLHRGSMSHLPLPHQPPAGEACCCHHHHHPIPHAPLPLPNGTINWHLFLPSTTPPLPPPLQATTIYFLSLSFKCHFSHLSFIYCLDCFIYLSYFIIINPVSLFIFHLPFHHSIHSSFFSSSFND